MTAAEAKALLHAIAEAWPADDLVRAATWLSLGKPAEVPYGAPAKVAREPGDTPDTNALRPVVTRESTARGDVYQAWRSVGEFCGKPLPRPGST